MKDGTCDNNVLRLTCTQVQYIPTCTCTLKFMLHEGGLEDTCIYYFINIFKICNILICFYRRDLKDIPQEIYQGGGNTYPACVPVG